jgi:predicted nucleic acid-binding protein
MKVFLDSSVLLEIVRGRLPLRRLIHSGDFELHINPVVLQEFMSGVDRIAPSAIVVTPQRILEVVELDTMTTPLWTDVKQLIKDPERFHANDLLNIEHAAMTCDRFLTVDRALARISRVLDMEIVDARTFLGEDGGAAR